MQRQFRARTLSYDTVRYRTIPYEQSRVSHKKTYASTCVQPNVQKEGTHFLPRIEPLDVAAFVLRERSRQLRAAPFRTFVEQRLAGVRLRQKKHNKLKAHSMMVRVHDKLNECAFRIHIGDHERIRTNHMHHNTMQQDMGVLPRSTVRTTKKTYARVITLSAADRPVYVVSGRVWFICVLIVVFGKRGGGGAP